MAYVIAEPCISTKNASCVEVCPVDCIQPGPSEASHEAVDQLYIDPGECIDCNACAEVCPVEACFPRDELPLKWESYAELNAEYFRHHAVAQLDSEERQ